MFIYSYIFFLILYIREKTIELLQRSLTISGECCSRYFCFFTRLDPCEAFMEGHGLWWYEKNEEHDDADRNREARKKAE